MDNGKRGSYKRFPNNPSKAITAYYDEELRGGIVKTSLDIGGKETAAEVLFDAHGRREFRKFRNNQADVLKVLPYLPEVIEMLKLRELCGDVGEDEKVGVLCVACKLVDTFVGKLYRAVLLVDYEVERVGHHGHFTRVVLEVVRLGLEQDVLHAFLAEEDRKSVV